MKGDWSSCSTWGMTKENRDKGKYNFSRINEGFDNKMQFALFQCVIVQCSSKAGPGIHL